LRKRLLRALALFLIPPIGALIIRLFYMSSKKVFHLPKEVPAEPAVMALWHGDLFYIPFIYFKIRKKPDVSMVISDHFDGKIIAKTNSYLNLKSIHGSSTRNGAKVLIAAMKVLKNGGDIGITPDGPKGPRHEVADGIIIMAQKTKSKIVVLSCVPQRYWQLKSWDKFTIPKPFTTVDLYASEPIDITGMEREEARALIKEQMLLHDY
jgi:lysophospholipid acyltransferase (LPLAT)-like uncharacterized protein